MAPLLLVFIQRPARGDSKEISAFVVFAEPHRGTPVVLSWCGRIGVTVLFKKDGEYFERKCRYI